MVTLSLFVFSKRLCMWRAHGGRLHVTSYLFAATLWCGLLLLEFATRKPIFAFATNTFLRAASRLR